MKRLIYILLTIICLTACQQEQLQPSQGRGVLELDLQRMGRPTVITRAVDDDLTVDILKDGVLYNGMHFTPGNVPVKIVLEPGLFTIRAYTDNQDSWKTANGGKGESCYMAETTVEMEEDMVKRLTLQVPMTNYAVSLELPEFFNNLFRSYVFTLKSGGRTTTIKEGEKAYFDPADQGFSYALSATNTDGNTHAHSAINFPDVAAGKLFTLRYSYDSDATSGGVDIVITDDMETDDTNVSL